MSPAGGDVGARRRTLVAWLSLALVAAACATNPVTGKREISLMSEAQEIQLGREMDPQVRQQFGVYDDAELQRYVSSVGLRLVQQSERPNLPWHFTVVDSPAVNAFALPGGYIYLTRGIMAYLNDEAELAGVLGHEIGHVTARHAAQQYTRATGAGLGLMLGSIFFPEVRPYASAAETGLGLLFLKYGRDDELQSDQLGAKYAAANGWDPNGVPDMLRTLGRINEETDRKGTPNWLLTHPQPADRVERIQETVKQLSVAEGQRVERAAFVNRIAGIVYGDNPKEGIVRGRDFLHRDLRFAVTFPEGWEIQNSPTQVASKAPGANVFMLLDIVQQPQGRNLADVAVSDMSRVGFRALEGGATTINGLAAAVGTFQGQMQQLGNVVARVAYISHGRQVFRVSGLAPRELYDRASRDFANAIGSFRPMSAGEAENIRPNVLALHTVREGETWQSIAERETRGVVNARTLAVLNGSDPGEPPRAGDRIKIARAQ
jgi:predicted Zn-dependent protease